MALLMKELERQTTATPAWGAGAPDAPAPRTWWLEPTAAKGRPGEEGGEGKEDLDGDEDELEEDLDGEEDGEDLEEDDEFEDEDDEFLDDEDGGEDLGEDFDDEQEDEDL